MMELTEEQKTIKYGLELREEELKKEVMKLDKSRAKDFIERDIKIRKLSDELEDIQESLMQFSGGKNNEM